MALHPVEGVEGSDYINANYVSVSLNGAKRCVGGRVFVVSVCVGKGVCCKCVWGKGCLL